MTKRALNLLLEQKGKENTFEFTEFPILLKGTDVFKPAIETGGDPSVNPEPLSKQFRNIRRSGNWPKGLLQTPNLEHRIIGCFLSALDRYKAEVLLDSVYVYIEADESQGHYYSYGDVRVRVVNIEKDSVKELTGMNFTKTKR